VASPPGAILPASADVRVAAVGIHLVRAPAGALDESYLDRWAAELDVVSELDALWTGACV